MKKCLNDYLTSKKIGEEVLYSIRRIYENNLGEELKNKAPSISLQDIQHGVRDFTDFSGFVCY